MRSHFDMIKKLLFWMFALLASNIPIPSIMCGITSGSRSKSLNFKLFGNESRAEDSPSGLFSMFEIIDVTMFTLFRKRTAVLA